jgi:mRNA interferase MazF
VVVQADELFHLSAVLAAPTSTGSWPASFRPTITLDGSTTRVLVEQTVAVDRRRLGPLAGRLDASEQGQVDEALQLVLAL